MRRPQEREAARDALKALGPQVMPAVLERLRGDLQTRNRVNDTLLDVLGMLGGHRAVLHAVLEGAVSASACVAPFSRLGDEGVAGLLGLLEAEQASARAEAARELRKAEYSPHTSEFVALLEHTLDGYARAESEAVRRLQQEAVKHLIAILGSHQAEDAQAIASLVRVAREPTLADRTRIAALETIAALGPVAGKAAEPLRSLLGYESGPVRQALLAALEQVDRQN